MRHKNESKRIKVMHGALFSRMVSLTAAGGTGDLSPLSQP